MCAGLFVPARDQKSELASPVSTEQYVLVPKAENVMPSEKSRINGVIRGRIFFIRYKLGCEPTPTALYDLTKNLYGKRITGFPNRHKKTGQPL